MIIVTMIIVAYIYIYIYIFNYFKYFSVGRKREEERKGGRKENKLH